MTPSELNALLADFLHTNPTRLTDDALLSLVRIGEAVCGTIRTVGTDTVLGTGEVYLRAVRNLQQELNRRYVRSRSVVRRCWLLSGLFSLHQVAGALDVRAAALLDRRAERLIASYMEHPADRALCPVLELLCTCLYGSAAADVVEDPWIGFLHEHLAQWAATLDDAGRWPGLSDAEALKRIALMDRCGWMLLDDRYRSAAQSAYDRYCMERRLRPAAGALSPEELRTTVLEYDLILRGTLARRGDESRASHLAARLERCLEALPAASDEAWLCCSIVVDDYCRGIVASIENSLWAAAQ